MKANTGKKAIAYVGDVILGTTGEIISRDYQRSEIAAWADENGVEVVKWYEDSVYAESLFQRPGVRAMLDDDSGADMVLVERVWSLSRNWKDLNTLIERLEAKGKKVESTTNLWDCVSQMTRQYYTSGGVKKQPRPVVQLEKSKARHRVRRPATMHFAALQHHKA